MEFSILSLFAVFCYFSAGALYGLQLFGRINTNKFIPWLITLIAVSLHAVLLYHWIDGGVGQNLSFFNMFSQVLWLITLLLLVIAYAKPLGSLALLVLPLAAVSVGLASFFPGHYVVDTSTAPAHLVHILLSLLAISILGIAAIQAVLLAFQDHLLRQHYGGAFAQALPSIESLETFLFQILTLGFILLTLVLVSSFYFFPLLFAHMLWQHTLLAFAAWLMFAILLAGRWHFGWRGQIALRWTLGGVSLLTLSYIGSCCF